MGNWHIVVPEATINKVLNPSLEVTGGVVAVGGGAIAYVKTYQLYGTGSVQVTTGANDDGCYFSLDTLTNAIHYATVRVRGTLPASWDWSLDNATYVTPVLLENIDSDWALYGYQFPAAQANGSTTLYIRQNGAGAGSFYVDGVQVEAKAYWTTLCDGDQKGCWWVGTRSLSASKRSSVSRAGGVRTDLDDFSLDVTGWQGFGAAQQNVNIDKYAVLPGGEFNGTDEGPQEILLLGAFRSTSIAGLHALRNAFIEEVAADKYPQDKDGWQPIVMWYTGGAEQRTIELHYVSGLEGFISADNPACYWERVALEFVAPTPRWRKVGDGAVQLDVKDSATVRNIARRDRVTGQWDEMGPPNAAGTYTDILAIAEDEQYIYIGGNFLNFDNIAAADRIVRYNKYTGTYSAMGSGFANGEVKTIVVAPNGYVYAGGSFTLSGATNRYRLAVWTGATWAAVGAANGMNNIVYRLYWGQDGNLYIGGSFTDVNGGPGGTYNRICYWDGSAYNAVGTGADNDVYAIGMLNDATTLYIGGNFANVGGVACNYIAQWDGSAWSEPYPGLDNFVRDLIVTQKQEVVMVGSFANLSGGAGNLYARIAQWNGNSFLPYGKGLNAAGDSIREGFDGVLHAGGQFTGSGTFPSDEPFTDGVAKWLGSSWATLDISLPGSAQIEGLLLSNPDPVVPANYDIVIGWNTNGTAYFAGAATVNYPGNARTYPTFSIYRTGGTSAVIWTLRNETTGKQLYFNYNLQEYETLYLYCKPGQQKVVSSVFGERADALLGSSDLTEMYLVPGANIITCFVEDAGGATILAYCQYEVLNRGAD